MAAFLDVLGRAAEAEQQEVAQALLGSREIVGRIHGTENIVAGDLLIEGADEALETVVADAIVKRNFHCL
jgi:hypothetical protein